MSSKKPAAKTVSKAAKTVATPEPAPAPSPAPEPTPAPAPEPAAEAAAPVKSRGPKGVPDSAIVHLKVTVNPKREGSKARERFAAYVDGATVGATLDAGVTTPDLVYDAKHGFISIDGYDPGEIVVPKEKAPPKPKAEKTGKAKTEKSESQKAAEAAANAEAKEEVVE